MTSEREERLEETLARFIQPINNVPLEIFIRAWFGHKVGNYVCKCRKQFSEITARNSSQEIYWEENVFKTAMINAINAVTNIPISQRCMLDSLSEIRVLTSEMSCLVAKCFNSDSITDTLALMCLPFPLPPSPLDGCAAGGDGIW